MPLSIETQFQSVALSCHLDKLDFVHLSGITDDVNQALKRSGRGCDCLVFLVDR